MMACLKRIDTVASGDTADATSPTPPQTTKGSSKNTQMVIGVSCTSSSRTSPCSSSRDTSDHELSGRKKRPRTAFTLNQIKQLESEFENCKYLSVSKRTQLSSSLGLSETQVSTSSMCTCDTHTNVSIRLTDMILDFGQSDV